MWQMRLTLHILSVYRPTDAVQKGWNRAELHRRGSASVAPTHWSRPRELISRHRRQRLSPPSIQVAPRVRRQAQGQRMSPPWPASVACKTATTTYATLPLLPASGVKKNSHFISLKTPKSRLASSARGREDPKPLSTAQTLSPSLMCQHHHMNIIMCMCVSIFTIIFFEGINHSTCHVTRS
jgi:hypothetical protein